MMTTIDRARQWAANDADPADRDEILLLIDRATGGEADAIAGLEERFAGPLKFGTAGLRGVMGAGETRMNRSVVRRATWGLVRHLLDTVPDAAERGLVVGRDARHDSDLFMEDVVAVAAALGMRVHALTGHAPTPLVAYGVLAKEAAGGVVVTASHNPPEYNGYKVYFGNGAQIIPPHDRGIAEQIERAPAANAIEVATDSGLIVEADELVQDYIDAVAALVDTSAIEPGALRIVYTAMHGVGERCLAAAMDAAGFTDFESVTAQAEPDGNFPTVAFPNPEEPGALDLALALADERQADLLIANDPDADRLAAAVPDGAGGWRVLTGNEIGVLLGHHALTRRGAPSPEDLVVTTVVSSAQLGRIADDLGASSMRTLTGFKWIANQGMAAEAEGKRFVFGYEEALGYTIGTVARDKDGIGAALVFSELAATEKARGRSVLDRLAEIRRAHGMYVTRQKSVTMPGQEGAAKIAASMDRLRNEPASQLAGVEVAAVTDLQTGRRWRGGAFEAVELPSSNVLIYELVDGSSAAIRPSGTEPKIKLYVEAVDTLGEGESMTDATVRADARIDALIATLLEAAGL